MAQICRQHLLVTPDSAGYYLIVREKGSGASIDSGKVVDIEYEGRFLNDSLFDGTKGADHPYRFISGAGHVILGWELALKKLHAGDKITLITPSSLAFGEEGIRNTNNGTFIVTLSYVDFSCYYSGRYQKINDTIILDSETVNKSGCILTTNYYLKITVVDY